MLHLQQKESVCDFPFFKSMSVRGMPGKMETVTAFSGRLRLLGFRASYPYPLTIYNFRVEGLYQIDLYANVPLQLNLLTIS